MKIAILGDIWNPVSYRSQGGRGAFTGLLADGLVELGHQVTLFATGDSQTKARLISVFPRALGHREANALALHCQALLSQADKFEVIINNLGHFWLPFTKLFTTKTVTIFHYPDQDPINRQIFLRYKPGNYFVAPSIAAKSYFHLPPKTPVIHHGIRVTDFVFQPQAKKHLLYLGRLAPDKGVLTAIAVAIQLQQPLVIAGVVPVPDQPFFQKQVLPLIKKHHSLIKYIGPWDYRQKTRLLGQARALLHPVSCQEVFGLVLVEALAAGVPVVAFDQGATKEIITKQAGLVVKNQPAMITAIKKINGFSRLACRRLAETKFTVQKMARAYHQYLTTLIK